MISPNTATGTVTFSIDETPQAPVTISGGTATLATSTLSVGSHSITAAYSGDTNDLSSTSTITDCKTNFLLLIYSQGPHRRQLHTL
ncbi:Ig-like domain-containing protein [Candidatus Nitrosotalea okcheonensis]|uniref:Bacterial Ig-like domain-containing protein n=1 Tax=Candidatus Nitrosotalea okcheonensis TaxID=1903276 RepID=A0A2H1FGK0_9ARCH|nr:protein of unknown function [Candidatus Nitrosotalea okcheonensis]